MANAMSVVPQSLLTSTINEKWHKVSFSRMVVKAVIAVTPKSVLLEILEIAQLPILNLNSENASQHGWIKFWERLKELYSSSDYSKIFLRKFMSAFVNMADAGKKYSPHMAIS